MKTKSNRRSRRQRGYRGLLWVLAAGLLLFGLIAQQDILLGTSSRHALLMDARTGRSWPGSGLVRKPLRPP